MSSERVPAVTGFISASSRLPALPAAMAADRRCLQQLLATKREVLKLAQVEGLLAGERGASKGLGAGWTAA